MICPDLTARVIHLAKNKFSLVSKEDYQMLSQYKWCTSSNRGKFYVARYERINGKYKGIYMHRQIVKPPDGFDVDHINRNSLDNRRSNLRIASRRQNCQNQTAQLNRSSKYKGVYRHAQNGWWVVQIKDGGKVRIVSGIESEEIAAAIYDLLAADRFKEFACLNFPNRGGG